MGTAEMMTCKVDGCPKPAGVPGTAWGWCSTHYHRWKRTGDPLTTLTSLKPKPPADCSVDGCDTPRWARGLCGTHYRRLMTKGEIGTAERQWVPAVGKCTVPGCRKPVKATGFCQAHYLRNWRYGDPTAGGPQFGLHDVCAARFCNREHYALGLCNQHWKVQGAIAQRAAKLGVQIPGFCTPEQLIARIDYYANRCWMCGAPADQIDHVKPLAKGGSNWPSNLRPACGACNYSKSRKWPFTPAAKKGRAA